MMAEISVVYSTILVALSETISDIFGIAITIPHALGNTIVIVAAAFLTILAKVRLFEQISKIFTQFLT